MEIRKLNSNDCGGFRPPKGHLDTQMYPECEGTETDRNIVRKTVEQRKKNKKKKKKQKTAKHAWPLVRSKSHQKEGIWEAWRRDQDHKKFVNEMVKLDNVGLPGLVQNEHVLAGVRGTLKYFNHSKKTPDDYKEVAETLNAWLAEGEKLEEEANMKIRDIRTAKHGYPIQKEEGKDVEGIWDQWRSKKLSSEDFVTHIKEIIAGTYGEPWMGISKDLSTRRNILNAVGELDASRVKDYDKAAQKISAGLALGEHVIEEGLEEEVRMAAKKKKKSKKKKKEWDPNPWAVCTKSVGREDKEKYERCIQHVKEQQAFNLSKFRKQANKIFKDENRTLELSGQETLDPNLQYTATIKDEFGDVESVLTDATLSEIYVWAKEHNFSIKQ